MTARDNKRSTSDNSVPPSNGIELSACDDPRLIRTAQFVYSGNTGATTKEIARQFAICTDTAEQRVERLVEAGLALRIGDDERFVALTVKGKRLSQRGMNE